MLQVRERQLRGVAGAGQRDEGDETVGQGWGWGGVGVGLVEGESRGMAGAGRGRIKTM